MRLSDFRIERRGDRVRASAAMSWEDCDREDARVFFETDAVGEADLICNPHSFLVACAVPALHFGERRIYLDAPLCPVLLEGLTEALTVISAWFRPERSAPLAIEAKSIRSGLLSPATSRAGSFFSGGIDSWATLRLNMEAYPAAHPLRITEGVLVYGLEQDDPDKFEHVRASLGRAADAAGIALTTVATNAYLLYREEDMRNKLRFWSHRFQGAALASVAHALAHRLSSMSISGTMSPRTLEPYGSHPALDPRFSSSDMRIAHTGGALTRLEKTALVAEWGLPLAHLRVCNQYRSYEHGVLNCGTCGKCLRTRLTLLALGEDDAAAGAMFASNEMSVDLVERRFKAKAPFSLEAHRDLVEPLRRRGHRDLARALERKVEGIERRGFTAGRPPLGARLVRRARRWLAR